MQQKRLSCIRIYHHTPETHSAIVDDSKLWADMRCHVHVLAPSLSIFQEVQGTLQENSGHSCGGEEASHFVRLPSFVCRILEHVTSMLCESLWQGDFSFGRPKLHREAARDRLPHGPEPSGHLQRMGITALKCLKSSYRVLSILHMFTWISRRLCHEWSHC